jgi:formylmethanofuran dehydrogenase subunit E
MTSESKDARTENSPRAKTDNSGSREYGKLSDVIGVREGGQVPLGPGLGSISMKTLEDLVSFHGYLATGVFLGIQMLYMGKRLLNIEEGDRIHVECETFNCLPDPFQLIEGCTVGNKGLIVRDTGKMAVTMTRHAQPGEDALGVRIVFDAKKTENFPRLYSWYMKKEKVPHTEAVKILMEAGESVFSHEFIKVPVSGRPKKVIAICEKCGESFIKKDEESGLCVDCGIAG